MRHRSCPNQAGTGGQSTWAAVPWPWGPSHHLEPDLALQFLLDTSVGLMIHYTGNCEDLLK